LRINSSQSSATFGNSQFSILPILLLATILQFYGLAADSLWGDEIFTAIFAAQPPAEVIAFTASDIHPPLYYLLVGAMKPTPLWPQGTPSAASDWLWRWPSAMMGVLTVAVTYRLGQTLFGKRVGLMAALLLAVAPVAIKYGQEARMHALFMFLSALSTLFLALILLGQGDKETRRLGREAVSSPEERSPCLPLPLSPCLLWIAYTITTILNLYTMYFAFIIIAVHGAWMLADALNKGQGDKGTRGQREEQRVSLSPPLLVSLSSFVAWSATILIAFLAYLPWWPTLIKILAFRAQVGAVEGGVGDPLAFLPKVVEAIGPFGGVAWLFFGLYLLGLFFAWKDPIQKRQREERGSGGAPPVPPCPLWRSGGHWPLTVLGGLWLALPALLPVVLGDSRALHLRYTFVLPVYLIFVALAVEEIIARGAWYVSKLRATNDELRTTHYALRTMRYALFAAMIVLTILSLFGVWAVYQQPKPDWRGAAALVAGRAGAEDVILAGPLWDDTRFFSYYYPYPDRVMPPPS